MRSEDEHKNGQWGQSKGSAQPILQDTAQASAKSLSKHHGHPNCSRKVKSYHRMVSEQHLQLATPHLGPQCNCQCHKLHTPPWAIAQLSVSQATHPALGHSATVSVTSYTPRPGPQCHCQCHKLHTPPWAAVSMTSHTEVPWSISPHLQCYTFGQK